VKKDVGDVGVYRRAIDSCGAVVADRIRLLAEPSGPVGHLTWGVDDGDDRVFSGSAISSVVTPDSIRATVVLDAGTEERRGLVSR
jgi:hypothetical protein